VNKFDGRKERSEFRFVHKGVTGVNWHEYYHLSHRKDITADQEQLARVNIIVLYSLWNSCSELKITCGCWSIFYSIKGKDRSNAMSRLFDWMLCGIAS